MAPVSLRKLVKRFKDTEVLHGIDLEVGEGEFVVLVGPSGCGKSTTLRMIAGLEDISDGEIAIGGRVVNHVEPKDRNIAMVFQNYAIYPHMTVSRNIGFGLRTSKLSREEKEARIRETAELLDLTPLLDRKPSQLSGGQRQRVAIGRAMVRDPAVFLFDEPLSNLDAQLRAQMRLEIKKLHQRLGSTIIFVTHDQVEAMTLADRIVIMRDGYIQQIGTPTEVYRAPANVFVAQFIGSPSMNLVPATADGEGGATVDGIGAIPLPAGTRADRSKGILLGIRPDDLRVENSERTVRFEGTVNVVEPLGHEMLVYMKAGENELIAKADGRTEIHPGDAISVSAPPGEIHVFDQETGVSLRGA